jgi:hypothetical protein
MILRRIRHSSIEGIMSGGSLYPRGPSIMSYDLGLGPLCNNLFRFHSSRLYLRSYLLIWDVCVCVYIQMAHLGVVLCVCIYTNGSFESCVMCVCIQMAHLGVVLCVCIYKWLIWELCYVCVYNKWLIWELCYVCVCISLI